MTDSFIIFSWKVQFSFFFQPHCAACGILVPDQGSKPYPLHWKCGVLTPGLPGKSPKHSFYQRHLLQTFTQLRL